MPRFTLAIEEPQGKKRPRRVSLDERFITEILPDTPLDLLEAQELRQALLQALHNLTPRELKVVELRYQHKKSPGQVAAQLDIARPQVRAAETRALSKLRRPLAKFLEP
jgi:RNA polymerase sigma factor (sigma-70 family)